MGILRLVMSMSLDGYIAGPGQSMSNPLGQGGDKLHQWMLELGVFRKRVGLESGVDNPSAEMVRRWMDRSGATIMGRNVFGGQPGEWKEPAWNGWWGNNPPFHHPVFVLTHHPRPLLQLEENTSFTFVSGGIDSALEQARAAAGDRDVMLVGGAETAQQYLAKGLVDEFDLTVVPVLLGGGEQLFRDDTALDGLALTQTVAGARATHMIFTRQAGE